MEQHKMSAQGMARSVIKRTSQNPGHAHHVARSCSEMIEVLESPHMKTSRKSSTPTRGSKSSILTL